MMLTRILPIMLLLLMVSTIPRTQGFSILPHHSSCMGVSSGTIAPGTMASTTPSSRTTRRLLAVSDENDNSNNDDNGTQPPSSATTSTATAIASLERPEQIAAMMEKSFVEGVMQLATGYVETIKLFIAAVLTAYGGGEEKEKRAKSQSSSSGSNQPIPYSEIMTYLDACPVQTANRPLLPEEAQLRATWVALVYLIADHVGYRRQKEKQESSTTAKMLDANADAIDDPHWSVYQTILPRLQSQHAQAMQATGANINNGMTMGPPFRAQEIWHQHKGLLEDAVSVVAADADDEKGMQKALLLQNLRFMWIVLTVLEEEKLCLGVDSDDDADNALPPPPPIPNKLQ